MVLGEMVLEVEKGKFPEKLKKLNRHLPEKEENSTAR